jgi:hypothetical protein
MASLDDVYIGFNKKTTFNDSSDNSYKCKVCNNNMTFISKTYDLEKSYKGFPMRSFTGITHSYKNKYICNKCKKIEYYETNIDTIF